MKRILAHQVPATLRICAKEANVEFPDVEADGPKRFAMTAYTGGKLAVAGWKHPVVVDLAGLEITAHSRPVLKDHDRQSIVGHTDRITSGTSGLEVHGVISGSGTAAREVLDSSKNGFPWRASIGAMPTQVTFIPKGKTVEANGQTFEGPLYLARKAVLQEVSFVALGADDDTTARVSASRKEEPEEKEFEAWARQHGIEIEGLGEDGRRAIRAIYASANVQTAQPEAEVHRGGASGEVPSMSDYRRQMADQTRRIAAIRAICQGEFPEIEARAIEENWSTERCELAVLRESRPKGPAIHAAETAPDGAAIEASLCLSAGIPEPMVAESYDSRTMDMALGKNLRGAGLHTLVYEVLRAGGESVSPGRIDDEVIRSALVANNRLIQAASGFTTLSLSGILGNVANKTMLAAYRSVATVAQRICGATDCQDFKEVTRFRLTGSGVFEKVGPDGELKHADLSEESYTNRVETYGRLITLTRQMIINDDLGAFLQVPRAIGRMSALALEEAVFTLLLSNPGNFFSTGNQNYFTGATSALGIDSLTKAEQMFLDREDKAGKPILIQPAMLLVPTSLKVRGEQLYNEQPVNQVPAENAKEIAVNPHARKFRVISSPYLNHSSISGSSSAAWYLLASPGDIPFMEIAYLRGRRVPVIESGEVDFNVLGMYWRGYFDFGVAMQDNRAAVKSKGEA
jgi:hypothetical protein